MIRLERGVEGVVGLWLFDDVSLEEVKVLGQIFVREPGADFADRLCPMLLNFLGLGLDKAIRTKPGPSLTLDVGMLVYAIQLHS
jgi:hypothetical protein